MTAIGGHVGSGSRTLAYGELAAANPRARSVSHKVRGCRAETRSKESSTVKT